MVPEQSVLNIVNLFSYCTGSPREQTSGQSIPGQVDSRASRAKTAGSGEKAKGTGGAKTGAARTAGADGETEGRNGTGTTEEI